MMKSMAIVLNRQGGPDVLEYVEIDVPPPGPGQVQMRHKAIGVNFIDNYVRSGLYPVPGGFPYVAGKEGAGEIIAVGEGVTDFKVGDRVAYPGTDGAYSQIRNIAT